MSKAEIIKLKYYGFTVREVYDIGEKRMMQNGMYQTEKIFNGKYSISWYPEINEINEI